jgi:formylglycine-generating enzyme required for sulfatase activity
MSSYKLFMPIPILNFDSASPAAQFDIFATPRDELPVFLTLALANEWAKKVGMRLPSHSEWIYASRAGATTRFYWGDKHSDSPPHYINDGDIDNEGEKSMSFPRSRESSAGTANAFGLYNTLGNVCEWVQASSIPWREAFPEGISPSNRLTKSFDSWGAVCGGGVFQAVRIFDHELLQLAPDPENNNPGLAPRGLRPAASIP